MIPLGMKETCSRYAFFFALEPFGLQDTVFKVELTPCIIVVAKSLCAAVTSRAHVKGNGPKQQCGIPLHPCYVVVMLHLLHCCCVWCLWSVVCCVLLFIGFHTLKVAFLYMGHWDKHNSVRLVTRNL